MGNNRQKVITGLDIKNQLNIKMREMLSELPPEERRKVQSEIKKNHEIYQSPERRKFEETKKRNIIEANRLPLFAFFVDLYFNGQTFINNFLRKTSFEQFMKYDRGCSVSNGIDSPKESIHKLIDIEYIKKLILFDKIMRLSAPLEKDTIFYRGCVSLDYDGVNGLVYMTNDYSLAKACNRGTILTIVVPAGTRVLDAHEAMREVFDNPVFLIPPCDYEVIEACEKPKDDEPNNPNEKIKHIKLRVKPLDLLEEFLNVMHNPPLEYECVRRYQNEKNNNELKAFEIWGSNSGTFQSKKFEDAVAYLEEYLKSRKQKASAAAHKKLKTHQ